MDIQMSGLINNHKEIAMLDTPTVVTTHGRPIKFTPERIEQIKNLVERGHTRERIADIIGCTLGSLQVTCSRLGISLRRPRIIDGADPDSKQQQRREPTRRQEEAMAVIPMPPCNGEPPQPQNDLFSMEIKCGKRRITIPIDASAIGLLVLEAQFRDMQTGELLAEIIREFINKDGGYDPRAA
jgi:hypothetical protein